MVLVSQEELSNVQGNTTNVRNICVLAHVDHGKTTLSDFLICSNGIISQALAGKIRYMDSRPDEQQKGITMKSSAISLSVKRNQQPFIVNLIDSPGHVDFSSEVSTATRLADGALVLVDSIEGACIQTSSVLLQAYKENIKPCLVLNKVDRLIIEKQMTPMDAYKQLMRILEQVNVLMSTFKTADLFKDDAEKLLQENDTVDSDSFFSPKKGNVAIGSAVDGWAFRINDFAEIFSKKFGLNQNELQETLWGDFYFNPKLKQIRDKPWKEDQEPMFVQFILNNIYDIYNAVLVNRDVAKAEKIASNFKLSPNVLKKGEHRAQLKLFMSAFLPLSDSILGMVIDQLPNPIEAQRNRIVSMIPDLDKTSKKIKMVASKKQELADLKNYRKKLKKNLLQCDKSDNAEVLVFVSKMLEVDTLPGSYITKKVAPISKKDSAAAALLTADPLTAKNKPSSEEDEEDEDEQEDKNKNTFIGFARIFSGTIKVGQKLHILGPRYNAGNPAKHRSEFVVEHLYLLMGRSLEPVQFVPAGNIFGIGGIEKHVLKSATIASSPFAPIFSSMYFIAAPVVRIALEPKNIADMPKLKKGLQLLNHSDPSVEVLVQETGEHVIMTAGEIHAERCIRDLEEKFAGIPIKASAPLVNFRETILAPSQLVSTSTANKVATITVRAIPLPSNITQFIEKHRDQIRACTHKHSDEEFVNIKIFDDLKKEFVAAGEEWEKEWNNVWMFGPKRCGPNVLLNHIPNFKAPHFKPIWSQIDDVDGDGDVDGDVDGDDGNDNENKKAAKPSDGAEISDIQKITNQYITTLLQHYSSIVAGFQLATNAGPLCDEPVMGVAYCVENIVFDFEQEVERFESSGTFGGQIMSAFKEACRKAFDGAPRRLMEAMYKCEVQANQNTLGQMYGVLRKERAKVTDEQVVEGTDLFTITALLPVVESFGFNDELRTKTGGGATPQLLFSHWQVLDIDPNHEPTKEEIESGDYDEKAPNIARDYMNKVRERKGLYIKKKLVERGDAQRTMSKNK